MTERQFRQACAADVRGLAALFDRHSQPSDGVTHLIDDMDRPLCGEWTDADNFTRRAEGTDCSACQRKIPERF